jgi:peptidoglycan/xylan/chitin deacetylase (PgdA/CDA1 family)
MRTLVIAAICLLPLAVQSQQRTIAITIDDLPVVSTRSDAKTRREITTKILGHLRKAKAPAIGFVNENKLYTAGKRDEAQIDLLRLWLAAGMELGNHTYSHHSLNTVSLTDYEADLLKGEAITKELLQEKGREIRYFRHPFLHTGRSMQVKADFDGFLAEHRYRIAPISFDNSDYIFSRAYDIAFDRGDKKLVKQVGEAYVPYMQSKLEYWERQSKRLFGREIAETLLIHANFINSDYLDDLIAMFKKRGYKCVDLDTALKDEAYGLPDTYVGPAGISWIHRWALGKGWDFLEPNEPKVPDFVLKLSGFESE